MNRVDPMGTSFDELIARFIADNERKPSAVELADLFNNASHKDIYSDELTPTELALIEEYNVVSYSANDVDGLGKFVFGDSLRKDLADAAYARQWTRHNLMVALANADPAYGAYTKMFGQSLLALSPLALGGAGAGQFIGGKDKFEQAEGVLMATSALLPVGMNQMQYVGPQRFAATTAGELETSAMIAARSRSLAQSPMLGNQWNTAFVAKYGAVNIEWHSPGKALNDAVRVEYNYLSRTGQLPKPTTVVEGAMDLKTGVIVVRPSGGSPATAMQLGKQADFCKPGICAMPQSVQGLSNLINGGQLPQGNVLITAGGIQNGGVWVTPCRNCLNIVKLNPSLQPAPLPLWVKAPPGPLPPRVKLPIIKEGG